MNVFQLHDSNQILYFSSSDNKMKSGFDTINEGSVDLSAIAFDSKNGISREDLPQKKARKSEPLLKTMFRVNDGIRHTS